jgi:hypothetical protein
MSDAYGTLVFTKSNDFNGNISGLIDALNEWEWNTSNAKWILGENSDGMDIVTDSDSFGRDIQYPTVFPQKLLGVMVGNEDGEEVFVTDPTDDDFDMASDHIHTNVSLDELFKKLGAFLKSGSFEISCVANEKRRYVYFEKLKISSEGKVERSRCISGQSHSLENIVEAI